MLVKNVLEEKGLICNNMVMQQSVVLALGKTVQESRKKLSSLASICAKLIKLIQGAIANAWEDNFDNLHQVSITESDDVT